MKAKHFFITTLFIFSSYSNSQVAISEEFLEGLDPSIRDEIEAENESGEESELEKLFRAETSQDKNKLILKKINDKVNALNEKYGFIEDSKDLQRFGDNFFSSIQTTFMPINIPNLSDEYVVGIGDKFDLFFTGALSTTAEVMISRDGSFLVPDFGKVYAFGKTISELEKDIQEFVSINALGINVTIGLKSIRDVQVLALGNIENPGVYTLGGGSSALSLLNAAGGIAENGSYRKVDHKRNGQVIKTIDLYDIFIKGDDFTDLMLRNGDTLFVHPSSFIIPISGGIASPGKFELLPGEGLDELIGFAGGFSEAFYGFDEINISRYTVSGKTRLKVNKTMLNDFELLPRDTVTVPSFYSEDLSIQTVTLEGMVKNPGTYYIEEGTTLDELIALSGGYKDNAYIFGSALFRKDALEKEQLFAEINYRDTLNYIVSTIGQPNISISSSSIELLLEELKSQNFSGRVITDFELSNNQAKTLFLEDEDRIVIPSLQKIVYVFGDFVSTSNLQYEPEFSIKNYIERAGGLNESASEKLIIIDPNGISHVYNYSRLFKGSEPEIYPGSIIYAPREIGQLEGIVYAATVSPILSNLALALASLNSISNN